MRQYTEVRLDAKSLVIMCSFRTKCLMLDVTLFTWEPWILIHFMKKEEITMRVNRKLQTEEISASSELCLAAGINQ